MAQKKIEIIATSLADVVNICNSNADRIELVDDLKNGGLSPTLPAIEAAVKASSLPINVMLRPHSNSFVYTDDEFAGILSQLVKINKLKYKPNGIVFGSLTKSNEINEGQLKKIIAVKQDLELVFHRAFDQLSNYSAGIEIINRYPQVNGLLSSGTKAKATEGINELMEMVEQANTVDILVGSGQQFVKTKV